jgi:hypothetical protein
MVFFSLFLTRIASLMGKGGVVESNMSKRLEEEESDREKLKS